MKSAVIIAAAYYWHLPPYHRLWAWVLFPIMVLLALFFVWIFMKFV